MTLPEKSVNIDLKCGLLKNIYEDSQNKCIQIIIHKNKDYIINEKTFTMSYGVKLYYNVGKSIYTHDYATFELFIDKIKNEWQILWNELLVDLDNRGDLLYH